jgi:KDO2-lipid IV(A) lauroyltransferase
VTTREFRHRVEYAIVLTLRGAVAAWPDRVVRFIGTVIGHVFWAVDTGHRRLTIRQLQAAFPSRTPAECRSIARKTFAHFGRSLTLTLKLSTLTADEVRARVTYEGEERVREALKAGRGVLLVTGHFGYWELMAVAHALVLPPMSVLARPLDNPYLHDLLERTRMTTGNRVIYRRGAVRRVLRALNANEGIAILIDQHIQPVDAVTVQFFDRPAATTSAVAALALRTGAAVIPMFGLPSAHGKCRVVYEHPIELPGPDAGDPIVELTQRCTDVLEMYVRRQPELWLWMHRRWRDESAVGGMFPRGPDPEADATLDVAGEAAALS